MEVRLAIVVLIYHKTPLEPDGDSFSVTLERFKAHIAALRDAGCRFAPFSETSAAADDEDVPVVSITFDDAHRSNIAAIEHLRDLGIRPTVFVVQAWSQSDPQYMSADDIRRLAPFCDFGSHGASHTAMPDLAPADLDRELRESRRWLEGLVGQPVTTLAFPGGRHDSRTVRAAKAAGYAAIGTSVPLDVRRGGATVNRFTVHAWVTGPELAAVATSGPAAWRRRRLRHLAARTALVLLPDPVMKALWRMKRRPQAAAA